MIKLGVGLGTRLLCLLMDTRQEGSMQLRAIAHANYFACYLCNYSQIALKTQVITILIGMEVCLINNYSIQVFCINYYNTPVNHHGNTL